jgi:hypothetical protein
LSACDDTEIDAVESRREWRSVREDIVDGDSGSSFAALLLLAMTGNEAREAPYDGVKPCRRATALGHGKMADQRCSR